MFGLDRIKLVSFVVGKYVILIMQSSKMVEGEMCIYILTYRIFNMNSLRISMSQYDIITNICHIGIYQISFKSIFDFIVHI